MIDRWHAAGFLLQHWLRQESAHAIHSPGLYRFYTEVVYPKEGNAPDAEIEDFRNALKHGTGPHLIKGAIPVPLSPVGPPAQVIASKRTLRTVVSGESAGTKTACLLQRTSAFLQARRILEIGTSAGLTTLYLSARADVEVITLEGNPVLARLAREHFREFSRSNIRIIEADADDGLPKILNDGFTPDLVFLDANHRFEPTCRYVQLLLSHMLPGSIVVVHDIHHSKEMSLAWTEVSGNSKVTTSVNLGTTGILLTDPKLPVDSLYW